MNTPYYTNFSKPLMSIPTAAQWHHLLGQFDPISLIQLDQVALLNRIDTKYVLNTCQLFCALASLTEHYWILDIDNIRLNHYQTLYFDTADFSLYLLHHDGAQKRYKVRSRKYVDTGQSFLEVKTKLNETRTIKNRLPTLELLTRFTSETNNFMQVHFPLDTQLLEPKLWNDFFRITLVSKYYQERLTLDLYLQFCHPRRATTLGGIAIAEVKQDDINHHSNFIQQMRTMNIHPTGFSKYCIGISMLYPDVKHNNFKPELRLVDKLIRGDHDVQ